MTENQANETRKKIAKLRNSADSLRRRAGSNQAYNPKHRSGVERMMIGRADALDVKANILASTLETK